METRPIFYFSYANPKGDLDNLNREEKSHRALLMPRFFESEIFLFQYSNFSRDSLEFGLQILDKVTIFHFSGHAGTGELLLNDSSAFIDGIARQLKSIIDANDLPKLILFFLNGCSTGSMVGKLLDAGVPVVIGTSAPVSDRAAADFSINFYQKLMEDKTIDKSFEFAEYRLKTFNDTISINRGVGFDKNDSIMPLWGLFYNQQKADLIHWKVSDVVQPKPPGRYEINSIFQPALYNSLFSFGDARISALEERKVKGEDITEDIIADLSLGYPGPIGTRLARLLKIENDYPDKSTDELYPIHFNNIYDVYQSLAELLFLIMLSQLWDNCLNDEQNTDPGFPGEYNDYIDELTIIKDFFTTTRKERRFFDFIPRITALRKILDSQNIRYFIDELKQLRISLERDTDFNDCYRFFVEARNILESGAYLALSTSDWKNYCIRGEKQLAVFFDTISFSSQYDMGILKNIELLLTRFEKKPTYSYRVLKLPKFNNARYLSFTPKMKGFTSVRSIVMLKSNSFKNGSDIHEIKKLINLSPFILDLNVTDITAEKGNILVYSHFDAATGNFLYEDMLRPNSQQYITRSKNAVIFEEIHSTFRILKHVLFPTN